MGKFDAYSPCKSLPNFGAHVDEPRFSFLGYALTGASDAPLTHWNKEEIMFSSVVPSIGHVRRGTARRARGGGEGKLEKFRATFWALKTSQTLELSLNFSKEL